MRRVGSSGCGKSTPFAETKNNTSQDLVEDIEKLRTHLGIETLSLSGGSWGSTLALFYAIAHRERVQKILLWSVFLARQSEVDFVNEGYPRYFFPEEWQRFIALVPDEHRKNGDMIMRYYAERINSNNPTEASRYANEWSLWESTLLSIRYNRAELEKEIFEDAENTAVARLETNYFLNKCFVPENYILDNVQAIQHIPCFLMQGRFDMCSPAVSSVDLKKAYGANLTLKIVNSGHLRTDPEMLAALQQILADTFSS